MAFLDHIIGRPLASSEENKERLTTPIGVAVLGLDALASTGYGPEAALTALLPLGAAGLRYYPLIILAIVIELTTLYFSYRQTAAAYPDGGGAFVVAKDNFGVEAGVWAAVALMLDYVLNVTVAIAAGVGAIVSAIPAVHSHLLALCLLVLLTLTLVNLRGVRESGLVFVGPVFVFVGSFAVVLAIGIIQGLLTGGHPQPVVAPPLVPTTSTAPGVWLLLAAFANGCTAMTGIEAVSNGVPLFQEPRVQNARRTLTVIMVILGSFLLGLAYVCPAYQIVAMNEQEPGYQTILSQVVAAAAGRGVFYYISLTSIFIVLTYSAQTSFADFPRVCRLLAEDGYLTSAFAERGRRLVYSHGIVVLAIISAALLMLVEGITDKLIPLFAIGAFGGFLFSQAGMVRRWHRTGGRRARGRLVYNLVGAATTAIVLVIILLTKFLEGAWMTVVAVPALVLLLQRIHRHLERVQHALGRRPSEPAIAARRPVVVMPINRCDSLIVRALYAAFLFADEVFAVYVRKDQENVEPLKRRWAEVLTQAGRDSASAMARLEIVESPYRGVEDPVLSFIDRIEREHTDRMIAVVIPELVEPHWYDYLLRRRRAAALRKRLLARTDDRLMLISCPWFVRDR